MFKDPKPRPNQQHYLEVLRKMAPEQRLRKVFELSAFTKQLFAIGLRQRYPDLSDEEFQKVFLDHLARFHNRN